MAIADVQSHSIDELVALGGARAVVTGGAMGIGLGIARRLAEAGAEVALGDLHEVTAKERAAELDEEFGVTVIASHLDVADEASTEAFTRQVVSELGGIDIWINNAGIFPTVPFDDMTAEDWDRVLAVNLRGTYLGARAAAAQMEQQGTGGVIVNIASTAAYRAAGPGLAHYVASKHGVRGLTKSLALELGVHGIRVLGVAPTLIETPGIDANMQAFEEAGLADVIGGFAERLPLGRVGVADDVARVVLFCVSDLAVFMTGSTLAVDGGDLSV